MPKATKSKSHSLLSGDLVTVPANSYTITTTALDILVPEVEGVVGPYRQKYCPSAKGGMPSHITLLYPFVAPDAICEALTEDLRAHFLSIRPLIYDLKRVDFFSKTAYLCPEPAGPIAQVISDLMAKFPRCKPYGKDFKEPPPPHLTFAQAETKEALEIIAHEFQREHSRLLPIKVETTEVWLTIIENGVSTPTYRFRLAGL